MNQSIYYKDDYNVIEKVSITDEQFKILEKAGNNELFLIRGALANFEGEELEKKLLEIVYNYA
jgi:DNA-binding MarR family transcriptional regulator